MQISSQLHYQMLQVLHFPVKRNCKLFIYEIRTNVNNPDELVLTLNVIVSRNCDKNSTLWHSNNCIAL